MTRRWAQCSVLVYTSQSLIKTKPQKHRQKNKHKNLTQNTGMIQYMIQYGPPQVINDTGPFYTDPEICGVGFTNVV